MQIIHTFTQDGTVKLTQISRQRTQHSINNGSFNVFLSGNFGGGTIRFHYSFDDGANLIPLTGTSLAPQDFDAPVHFVGDLPTQIPDDAVLTLHAQLSNSSSPSVTVRLLT